MTLLEKPERYSPAPRMQASSARIVDHSTILQGLLGSLLVFVAINAFAGGFYAISGADGIPTSWLEDSSFHDYSIPGWILLVVVGGSMLTASISVFANARSARFASVTASLILLLWLLAELYVVGYTSWLQPLMLALSVLLITLSTKLNTRDM